MEKKKGSNLSADVPNLSSTTLKATAIVQTVENRADENSGQDDACNFTKEQFLKIKIQLENDLFVAKKKKTHVVIAADCSGSMSGNSWNQVKSAICYVLSQTVTSENVIVDIITYNHAARQITYTREDYECTINALAARGTTSFVAAFKTIEKILSNRKEVEQRSVIFLTDGQDTTSNRDVLLEEQKHFTRQIQKLYKPIIIHSVGFTKDHDYKFLDALANAGNSSGMFRYCEPADGPESLKKKIEELFDFVFDRLSQRVEMGVSIDPPNKMVCSDNLLSSATVEGEIIIEETAIDSATMDQEQNQVSLQSEAWILMPSPTSLPSLTITFSMDTKFGRIPFNCEVNTIQREVLVSSDDKVIFGMKILSRNTDILTTKLADTIFAKGDVAPLQRRLDSLQKRVSATSVFGSGVSKNLRTTALEYIKEIQSKINLMHSMSATYVRGETQSVTMLARANDLRYAAQFSKDRRQRLMDKRVGKNVAQSRLAQQELSSLDVDRDEINRLSQECTEFYFCVMSQNSIRDLLLSEEEKEDVMGFGIAVKRPEFVLDDPTSIRLCVISGTIVSKNSVFDALKYKISLSDHLSAHGGFQFNTAPLGVATVGMAREPINAWLPLFITKSHWNRVKPQLKPALGYLCTLDPLGFDFKQLDVMLLVLGSMIGELRGDNMGQHQLHLLFAFQRTCAAMVVDFGLTARLTQLVQDFLAGPRGRTRDIIPSLSALIGCMVALPCSSMRDIMGLSESESANKLQFFWQAFISELFRRAAGTLHKATSESTIECIVNMLLHGKDRDSKAPKETKAVLVRSCVQNKCVEDLSICQPKFDPRDGIVVPDIKWEHSIKVDKAMDLWAQSHCGIIKNKNRAEQVAAAKHAIKKWEEEGQSAVQSEIPDNPSIEDTGSQPFDTSYVTSSILKVMVQHISQLSKHCCPHVTTLPGCFAFLNFWLSKEMTMDEIDANSGIAPKKWIKDLQTEVTAAYDTINVFVSECEREDSENVLIVDDTNIVSTNDDSASKSDDEESDVDFDYDCDDGWQYEENRKQRRREVNTGPQTVNVLTVLRLMNPSSNVTTQTRALLCQAVSYHSNSKARTAAAGGTMLDLGNAENSVQYLMDLHLNYTQRFGSIKEKIMEKSLHQRYNLCLMKSTTMWAFAGYLLTVYKMRGEGFSDLVSLLLKSDGSASVPLIGEKVKAMLLGKYEDCPVIASGNAWIPEKKLSREFEKLLSEEVWTDIELALRSSYSVHVYRESDIPNRHGHCNSNPYIPERLRGKLSLPS